MWNKFFKWLKDFFGALAGFLQIALTHLKKEGLSEFKDFAVDTIIKIGEDPECITDEAKRKKFGEELLEEAKTRGKVLADHFINAIREMAIAYLKEKGLI